MKDDRLLSIIFRQKAERTWDLLGLVILPREYTTALRCRWHDRIGRFEPIACVCSNDLAFDHPCDTPSYVPNSQQVAL